MRLAFFLHSLSAGGAERVTATLANHWAARGWSVRIITVAPAELDQYPLHAGVGRTALGLATERGGPLRGPIGNARRILSLRRELRRFRPDAAVAMMCRANVVLAAAAWGLGSMVRLGSERVYPPRLPLGWTWEWLRGVAYRWLDGVVAQTEASRQWIAEHTSARATVIIPNPLAWPLPRQEPIRAPMAPQGGRRRLLAVGRLDRQKGFDLLLDAFDQARHRAADWELVILGEGPERGALEAQVRAAGLSERVSLPGMVGNVGDWYAAADAFVLSSRFEGFPNALLEAMASGLPVLSADCETGPGEIIQHGVNGLLVPAGRADALGVALAGLLADAALRARLAARAVEVRERYSVDRIAQAWEALMVAGVAAPAPVTR